MTTGRRESCRPSGIPDAVRSSDTAPSSTACADARQEAGCSENALIASRRTLCYGNAPECGVFSQSVPTGNNYGQKALACFLEFAIRFPPDQLIEGGLDRVRRQTKLVPDTETHPRLAKQMSAVPKPGIDLAGRESACGRADERGKANAVRCTPSTSMQPTARMRTKPLLVPKPGIDGCGSTRWRWQRLAAWARQLWKVALWPTGESPSVARPRQCRAVGAQHDQAADRSGANQIAGSSQARHQWMPLGPMRAAPPDKAAAARWPPTAAEQQTI